MKVIKYIIIAVFFPFTILSQGTCISGDCENGKGYWKDKSGYTYDGDFKNGKITGIGKIIYSFENEDNDEVGKIIYYIKGSKSYEGNFINGKYEGEGILTFNNGNKFDGGFKNGSLFSGRKYYKEAAVTLVGNFVENKLLSPGVLEFDNGDKYEGEVKNNSPNGKGTMFYPTKSKDVGFWENGRFLTGSTIDSKDIIKLTKDGGSYLIDVKLNGIPVNNMIFDTGAEIISLSASYLGALVENGTIKESDIVGDKNFLDASGNINSKLVINIKELTIGSVVIKNVEASICEECMLKGINLLGLNAIKGLGNIYIDFEKDRIILNRGIN